MVLLPVRQSSSESQAMNNLTSRSLLDKQYKTETISFRSYNDQHGVINNNLPKMLTILADQVAFHIYIRQRLDLH